MYTWRYEEAEWWEREWLLSGLLVTFLWWALAGLQNTSCKPAMWKMFSQLGLKHSWDQKRRLWSSTDTQTLKRGFQTHCLLTDPAVTSLKLLLCLAEHRAPPHSGSLHLVKQLNKFHLLEYISFRPTDLLLLWTGTPFLVVYNPSVMPIPYRCLGMFAHEPRMSLVHTLLPENCSCA